MECSKHGLTEHVFYSGRYRCKKCYTWYNAEKRKRFKKELVEYKGGKCEICGYDKCIEALEFHHLDETTKSFSISQTAFSKSLEELKKEADKCILLCANCHRELHAAEHKNNLNDYEKYAIDRKNRKSAYNKLNKELVCSLINGNRTQKEIAKETGVSVSTLKRFLSDNNIKMNMTNIKQLRKDGSV